jgi:hypothetical protein
MMSEINLYEQQMACNKALFDAGHYEAAYHILCAAKHFARDVNSVAYLREILKVANEQKEWIDVNAPENMLSTAATLARNGVNLLESLYRQIEGEIQIIESNQQILNSSENP